MGSTVNVEPSADVPGEEVMTTLHQAREPAPLREVLWDLLARHFAADPGVVVRLDLARQWAQDSYQRGHSDGYDAGYAAAVADIKRTEHDLAGALERGQTLWLVRGQKRTRATFGDPHPSDYPGQDGAA